jgi:hypothetical protein
MSRVRDGRRGKEETMEQDRTLELASTSRRVVTRRSNNKKKKKKMMMMPFRFAWSSGEGDAER